MVLHEMRLQLHDLIPPLAKRWYKWCTQPYYRLRSREVKRLQSTQRYQVATTSLLGRPIQLVDSLSFLSAYEQIIEREIYRFRHAEPDPLILDCGAHIGLAVL